MKLLTNLIITGIVLLLLDSIYLTTFGGFFNNLVQSIQGTKIKFKFTGAILCYLLIIYGLNYFIIDKQKSIKDAFILGIFVYGVYETTSYTILDKWNMKAVTLDTLWGGILFALTTKIVYSIKY
jgi:uncharacterized membrane protein